MVWGVALIVLALASRITPVVSDGTTPEQVHIAYAGRDAATGYPTGMTVSWATVSLPIMPQVTYGAGSHDLLKQQATTVQYFDTYYHHHAVLSNLQPGTKYQFTIGDDTNPSKTEEFHFTTAETSPVDLRIAVIGDMGVGKNSVGTMARLNEVVPDVDFLWHIGDLSYADDAFLEHPFSFDYEIYWNLYMNQVQNFTANTPYMVLPGNHEAECHSPACYLSSNKVTKLANFSAYNHRFRMPSDVSNGVMNMWYSFNMGPIHFVNMDTETDYPGSPGDHYDDGPMNGGFGDQLTWLKNDLEQAVKERSVRPWIVVGGHRPIYSVTCVDAQGNPSGDCKTLQSAIETLLYNYKVDLFVAGHKHGYERHHPTYNGVLTGECTKSCINPSSPIHIVDGGAGNIEGLTKYSGTPPAWNVNYEYSQFGYAMLTTKASHSQSDVHTLAWTYYNDAGDLLDSFTVQKSA